MFIRIMDGYVGIKHLKALWVAEPGPRGEEVHSEYWEVIADVGEDSYVVVRGCCERHTWAYLDQLVENIERGQPLEEIEVMHGFETATPEIMSN